MIGPLSATLAREMSLVLPDLPYWQGTQPSWRSSRRIPFSLGLDARGFVKQTTDKAVIDATVAAYSDAQYGFITPPPGTTAWGTRLGEQKLATLESMVGSLEGRSVLEIGGATLYLAGVICSRYRIPRYVCVDPALRHDAELPPAVELSRSYFPNDELHGQKFDLIIANSCIEHVADLGAFLDAAREATSDDGIIYLTFPDVGRCFRDGDLNALLHEHINYLDEVTARAIFASAGLRIIRWSSANDLASCLLAKGERAGQPSLAGAAMLITQALTGLTTRLLPTAERTLGWINQGRSVAFYGATNGLNNFLGWAGEDVAQKVTIVDGDAAKTGKFLSACPNPIVWSGPADYGSFDHVVVTAASFQDEIVSALVGKSGVPVEKLAGLFKPLEVNEHA